MDMETRYNQQIYYRKKFISETLNRYTLFHKVSNKKTLVYMYGVDVLQYIHIISGRKLLRQGIRILQDMNGLRHKSGSTKFWYKGRLVKARKFIIPDEYKIDKHRRRRFMVQMHRVFKSKGKKVFNERYSQKLYGQREGISSKYIRKKRIQIHSAILQDLQQAESRGKA